MLGLNINEGTLLGDLIARRQAAHEAREAEAARRAAEEAAAREAGLEQEGPAVISLGQVWVDIMMDVDSLPVPGGFAVSQGTRPVVGGSYRVLDAIRRMGVDAQHAGVVGNGVWGSLIRQAYADAGIEHVGQSRLDIDSGFRLVFHDDDGHKTFVANYGAEAHGDALTFDMLAPNPGDVVHVSGNTMLDHTAAGVDEFLERVGTDPNRRDYQLVINPTNTLRLVNDHMLEDLVLARPIWSCNRQEAKTLADRLGVYVERGALTVGGGFDKAMARLCEALGSALRAPLVMRAGARGAWVREPGGEVVHVEGFPTKAVHTRSAGACHTGTMCAMLAQEWSLTDAVLIANAASSLAIQRHEGGVPVCPTYEEAAELAGIER